MVSVPSTDSELGAVVVCIEADGSTEGLERTLRSVLANTPEGVPILLHGVAGVPGEPRAAAERVRTVAGSAGSLARTSSPADLVWLKQGCEVAPGWLEALRAAAHSASRVASATAMPSPDGDLGGEPAGVSELGPAAAAIRAASLRTRPRIEALGEHCAYLRRSAIELVEEFAGLREFSQRAVRRGLCHVLADDTVVRVPAPILVQNVRWPGLSAPAAAAMARARRAVNGPRVAIDARILSGPMNGSKLHALELTAALARGEGQRVTAFITPGLDPETRSLLERVPELRVAHLPEVSDPAAPLADLAHRPFQVESPADLRLLAQLGERTVITQQDLIGYHNPAYFPSPAHWRSYRSLTRRALAAADRIIFFSDHVRNEALAEQLVEPQRASVVHIGVDHPLTGSITYPVRPPARLENWADGGEVMVCLGTDYEHKNRLFALRILQELQRRHRWPGRLVFAGSHVRWGGSQAAERVLLEREPELGEATIDLGPVGEGEKRWLLGHASLVVYPTVSEGFGLVPFEAADHGTPCLWAAGTSLSEILPDSAAAIATWDPGVSADRALALMRDPAARSGNLEAIDVAGRKLRWDAAAAQLHEIYRATWDEPPSLASGVERSDGLMRDGFSEDAVRLVGPEGAFPRELERPLLALASRRRLSRPVFSVLRTGYRASQRFRRGSR